MDISLKRIWQIAWPVLVSSMMQHAIGLTDTAFLGRVGEVELGAGAIGSVYFLAIFIIGFGFSTGSQILIGQRNGAGKPRAIGSIVFSSGTFLMLLAGGLCLLSKFFTPKLMPYLISSPAVCNAALVYLDWRVYGLFFAFASVLFRAFFVGITRTGVLTVNSTVMVLSNVVLNYMLVFGKFGFPAMGIAGAAIASVAAEMFSVVFYLIYVVCKVDMTVYGLRKAKLFDLTVFSKVFNISVWTMMQSFLAVGTWFYFFVVIEHLGERPLAVVNLVRSVSTVFFVLISSFSLTASTLASNLTGAGEGDKVPALAWKITAITGAILTPALIFISLWPSPVLRVYTDNAGLIAASHSTLLVMAGATFLQGPAFIWFNTVSGIGETRTALFIEIITLAAYVAAVYTAGQYLRLSAAWCWTAEIIYQAVSLSLSMLYICCRKTKQS